MPLPQLDKITEIEAGKSISAIKCLSLSEEYLQDHFPQFPVMPGVLMLEALYQASSWLILYSEDFAHPLTRLKEAKNIKYQGFVAPGDQLVIAASIFKQDGATTTIKAQGKVNGEPAVSARLVVETQDVDEGGIHWYTLQKVKQRFKLLNQK